MKNTNKKQGFRIRAEVLMIGLLSLIIVSLLGLYLLNNNQVKAAAPAGFGVSVDTGSSSVDYATGGSQAYLGVRVKLVAPTGFNIKSDLSGLEFEFVESSEIGTKCTDLNSSDGSKTTSTVSGIPGNHGTRTDSNRYHTFGTLEGSNQLRRDRIFVKSNQLDQTKKYKLCVAVPYHRTGGSATMYAYVVTAMEFSTGRPKLTQITVKSATYTAADIGKNLEVVYTFDRPVKIVKSESSDNFVNKHWLHIVLPKIRIGSKTAVGGGAWTEEGYVVRATSPSATFSKNIVFKIPLGFNMDASGKTGAVKALNDEYFKESANIDSDSTLEGKKTNIGRYFGVFDSNGGFNANTDPWVAWNIVDELNREVNRDNNYFLFNNDDGNTDGEEYDYDINDFTVKIDTTPIVTLKQVTGGFDITHTPEKFKLKTFDTVTAATTNPSESTAEQNTITANWTLLKRTTVPKTTDKCETGTGITTVTTGTKAAVKEQMPSTPDDMWYCVHTQDVFTRKVMSSWMKYINDTTGPTISHTVVNNRLTLTVTDAGTGYKDDSLRWGALASDRRCVVGFAGELTSTSMAFNINQDLDNQVICVKAEDNSGNLSYKKITLKYNQSTTTPPTDTDDIDKDDDGQTAVDCNNLPDNWNDLTVSEKVRLNPCKCNDTTQIRADNGRCLSGGHSRTTTTTDDDETTTPAPPTTGDDDNTMDDDNTDDDMMDDEDNTDDTVDDDNTVDNDLAEIVLNFNEEDKVLTLTASGGELSNWMYAIVDNGQCLSGQVNEADYQTVEGNTVTVTQDDIDDEKEVCVKADRSDGSTTTQPYQLGQTTPSDETNPDDNQTGNESSETTDDDGTSPGLIIVIVVLVIAIIGVIIFIINKNKNNNQV